MHWLADWEEFSLWPCTVTSAEGCRLYLSAYSGDLDVSTGTLEPSSTIQQHQGTLTAPPQGIINYLLVDSCSHDNKCTVLQLTVRGTAGYFWLWYLSLAVTDIKRTGQRTRHAPWRKRWENREQQEPCWAWMASKSPSFTAICHSHIHCHNFTLDLEQKQHVGRILLLDGDKRYSAPSPTWNFEEVMGERRQNVRWWKIERIKMECLPL